MDGHGYGVDGSRGWAANLWNSLNEGGVWGVPRCGLTFAKRGEQLVLVDRMPWDPDMPITQEQLLAFQDEDIEGITTMFASIGIVVVPLEI